MLEQLEIKYGIKMDTASSSNGRRDAWFKFLSSTNAHADRLMREIVSLAYNTSSPDWDKLDSARKQHMTTEVATEIANLYSELSKDVHGTPSDNITLVESRFIHQHFNILRGMLNFSGTRYHVLLQYHPVPFSAGTAATASPASAIEHAHAAQQQAQHHVQQQSQPPPQQHEQMQMQMPSMQMMPATQMLPLPAGWVAGVDGSGHTYYYNTFLCISQWEHPGPSHSALQHYQY